LFVKPQSRDSVDRLRADLLPGEELLETVVITPLGVWRVNAVIFAMALTVVIALTTTLVHSVPAAVLVGGCAGWVVAKSIRDRRERA
jgi:hypothetical protein